MNKLNSRVGIQPHPGWEKPHKKEDRRIFWKKVRQRMRSEIRKSQKDDA